MKKFGFHVILAIALCMATSLQAQPVVENSKSPAQVRHTFVQPYEVTPGTFIELVLLRADLSENLPSGVIAQVTGDIYDRWKNLTIPHGSRLIGTLVGKRDARYLVQWTGLQIPTLPETMQLNPPWSATSSLGVPGIEDFHAGERAWTIVTDSIVIRH